LKKEIFQKYFFGMCEVKGQSLTEFVINAYWEGLKHMTDDQFIRAVNWAINEYEYSKIPQIAQLRKLFNIDNGQIAEKQAYEVIAEIKRIGSHGTPEFDDPVTALTVKKMGWQRLCGTLTEDKINWFVKEFSSLYEITRISPHNQITHEEAKSFLAAVNVPRGT